MLSYITLLITAAIWGFAFVAQRRGLESLDPFTFNALRFAVGALTVLLIRFIPSFQTKNIRNESREQLRSINSLSSLWQPVFLGVLLFIAASLQQTGMLWTNAGNAGFITGLYIVFVPLIGLVRGQRFNRFLVLVILLAVLGLWFMNRSAELSATLGNLFVLVGALFWAFHVQYVDKLTKSRTALDLALIQYTVCALLSFLAATVYHPLVFGGSLFSANLYGNVATALSPILYAGVMSVGIAFTLQIYAQKRVSPQVASMILCLEGVFAMLGGYLILSEQLTSSSLIGATLLLVAMLLSVLTERESIFLIDKKGALKT